MFKKKFSQKELSAFLHEKARFYEQRAFIDDDPVLIPHSFSKQQDIEISAFFAAVFAWGQRKTIINKCQELMELMDNAPYEFVQSFTENDLRRFQSFKHRTFNFIDLMFFLKRLQSHFRAFNSLEGLFFKGENAKERLVNFQRSFFDQIPFEKRTLKHIATPERKSTCKRLNMFLRWMVREPKGGVDFGIWRQWDKAELMIPLDVHVERVARLLGLIHRKQRDWETVEELTQKLRNYDKSDPSKFDYALFGLGLEGFAKDLK